MPLLYNFSNDWIAILAFVGLIFGVIGIAEFAKKQLQWEAEFSRKLVHVLVGVLLTLSPFIVRHAFPIMLLGLFFIFANYMSLKQEAFKGMNTNDRVTYGTVYFPVAFVFLVILYWDRDPAIFLTSMLVLAFADTAASIVGEKLKSRVFILYQDKKSVYGSLAHFSVALITILIFYPFFNNLNINGTPVTYTGILVVGIIASLIATVAESVSSKGSDNLTLTLSTAIMLDLGFSHWQSETLSLLLFWMIVSFLMAFGAFKLKSLNKSGFAGAFIMGTIMFTIGGLASFLPLAGFFALSSILSKISEKYTKQPDSISKKGSNRDIAQVYANAGWALLFIIAYYFTHNSLWYFTFLGALSAATADTWESEIGRFSKNNPILITTFKKVEKGSSGAISLLGSLGGLLGALTIALIGYQFSDISFSINHILLIVIGGFIGSIIDSFIGATIQSKFRCSECGKDTEKHIHCEKRTTPISGNPYIDNDVVNYLCTGSSALFIGLFLYYFM